MFSGKKSGKIRQKKKRNTVKKFLLTVEIFLTSVKIFSASMKSFFGKSRRELKKGVTMLATVEKKIFLVTSVNYVCRGKEENRIDSIDPHF